MKKYANQEHPKAMKKTFYVVSVLVRTKKGTKKIKVSVISSERKTVFAKAEQKMIEKGFKSKKILSITL